MDSAYKLLLSYKLYNYNVSQLPRFVGLFCFQPPRSVCPESCRCVIVALFASLAWLQQEDTFQFFHVIQLFYDEKLNS